MANRFWVTGGDGNWNSTTNWSTSTGGASGASVPNSSDAAIFNASSGAGTAVLDISPTIQTLNFSGFTGTLAFGTNTISLNSTGTIFTGSTTMTVTGTPQIIGTNATATSRTISPQAVTEANSISFNIIAGTGAFTITGTHAVRNIDFTDGVNPTGFAGSFGNTSSTIYGNLKASTGMTRNAGGTLTFAATSGTKSITTAGVTFACSLTFNGIGGTFAFQDALTQPSGRTFTITNGTVQLKSGATSTVGSFVANNANAKSLQSTTPSTQATLSQASGTVNVADLTIRDINATGGAAWNAYVDFENTDAGNNDGWDFGLSPPYASYEPPIIIRSFTQPRRF